ncbi:hypothetical protein SCOR_16045 [Sulfidibacter corallicola]|uniref:ABC transmembrane type-1 domain-containing protein n=1 Tax=Sulfidibacter corallicola TaxID=2818388 RepID=A0A8A4TYK0_SULCO|nr:hypothetical protein [Sulfidibacter corallicola]QTD54022.1 hypothetical protein J3U87_16370 [Sulfidibacter corallicola]
MKNFVRIAGLFLMSLGPLVSAQDDNPYFALQQSLQASNGQGFWFVFYQTYRKGGKTWSQRMTESFEAEEVSLALSFLGDVSSSQVLSIYRHLESLSSDADDLYLSGEEIALDLSDEFEIDLDPLLVQWLDAYGPETLGIFIKLISPGQYSYSFKNATVLRYRLPFTSLSPIWVLGSVPPSIDLDKAGVQPLAPYLVRSLIPYIGSFLYYILPAILIGVLLGIMEGYGVGWWSRGKPRGKVMSFVFDVLKGCINALPRFLLIILFVLLFRQFRKPIEFWMIAVPLGVSCIPLVMRRVSEQIQASIASDAIPLRRCQGFSHLQVLKELWQFRLFVIPLQEMFGQLIAFIYAETLIQFMVKMSEGTMAGISNQNSLGYVLVQVSYGISMARHQSLSPAFERFDLWYPLFMVLTLFTLLTLGALVLRQRIERGIL